MKILGNLGNEASRWGSLVKRRFLALVILDDQEPRDGSFSRWESLGDRRFLVLGGLDSRLGSAPLGWRSSAGGGGEVLAVTVPGDLEEGQP